MRTATIFLLLFIFGSFAAPAAASDDAFQANSLARMLPAQIVLVAPKDQPGLTEALAMLRAVKPIAFMKMPEGHSKPKAKFQKMPRKVHRKEADAVVLFLVNERGKVDGVYVAHFDDRQWAENCADAVRQWTYTPVEIGNRPAPILVYMPMHFHDAL